TSSGRSGRVSIGLTSLAADGRAGRAVGECGPVRLYASATRSTLQWDFRPTSPPRAPGPSVGAWPGEVVQPRGVEEDDLVAAGGHQSLVAQVAQDPPHHLADAADVVGQLLLRQPPPQPGAALAL